MTAAGQRPPARRKGRGKPKPHPERPLWFVVILLAAAMVLVAGIIAFAAFAHAYMIVLHALLMGLTAGVSAALLTDRLKLASGGLILLIGALFGLVGHGLYWCFFYLFMAHGSGMPFTGFVLAVADNTALMRASGLVFAAGPLFFWVTALLDIGIVILVSALLAREMHRVFGRL